MELPNRAHKLEHTFMYVPSMLYPWRFHNAESHLSGPNFLPIAILPASEWFRRWSQAAGRLGRAEPVLAVAGAAVRLQ